MMEKAPSELTMWEDVSPTGTLKMTDEQINEKYTSGEQRIVTESNREKLPNFIDALRKSRYMELRPFYQRRPRWDPAKRSKLIESFIMNVPVPPVFLYEIDYNRYEVMDGQQRISAIHDFYDNKYKLIGLDKWPEINGKTYSTLPSKIRAGIDRRSISYILLLKESAIDEEDALAIRQLIFERLNTGGVELEAQEIRNCLYQGMFNDLLHKLSQNVIFRSAWKIPAYRQEEDDSPSRELCNSTLYSKMEDVELILRFYALRHHEHFRKGMRGFLDLYMIKSLTFSMDDIIFLRNLFESTITLAYNLYGNYLFRPFNPNKGIWENRPHKTFYDAVMVSLSEHLDAARTLEDKSSAIIEETQELFRINPPGTFTGRANTKIDIENRIDKYASMLRRVIGS